MTEVVAEFFRDAHRPHRAPRAQHSIGKLRIALDREWIVRKLATEPALEILAPSVCVAPLGAAVNQGIAQPDQSISFAKRGPPFIEGFGVSDDQRKLVLVKNGRPADCGPEMRWHGENATLSNAATIGGVLLDLQIELVDGGFKECRRGKNSADHIHAMAPGDVGIDARPRVLFLQLAGQLRHVPCGEQVVAVETGRNLLRRASAVSWLRRNINLGIVG